jgi:hypothetical protein
MGSTAVHHFAIFHIALYNLKFKYFFSFLIEVTIDSSFTRYASDKLVGDKAYGSDSFDQQLL